MTDHHEHDDRLRDALAAEAVSTEADDALLARIQAAGRRGGRRPLAPWLLTGAVALLAVVAVVALTGDDDHRTVDAVDRTTPSTTSATTSTTDPTVAGGEGDDQGEEQAERPGQAVAVTAQGHVVVLDVASGAVVRDLGGFDDPTDPDVADHEGGPFSITGVALHPNGRDVYFETCCEPAAGSIYRVPIDGSVPIDGGDLEPVAFGYGIDISADGRWLGYADPVGVGLLDLTTGGTTHVEHGAGDVVQVAVNHDGTEVTAERALEYEEEAPANRILRSELTTFHREADDLVVGATSGGDIRLLPIYAGDGTELTTVPARNGIVDLNVDPTGRWFLVVRSENPMRGYSEAADDQEIPGPPYLAGDW